jgi:hypothetical protein
VRLSGRSTSVDFDRSKWNLVSALWRRGRGQFGSRDVVSDGFGDRRLGHFRLGLLYAFAWDVSPSASIELAELEILPSIPVQGSSKLRWAILWGRSAVTEGNPDSLVVRRSATDFSFQ